MIAAIHKNPDSHHPGLELYRTLKRQQEHRKQGLFVAEGEKVILRLFASGLRVFSVLLDQQSFDALHEHMSSHPDLIDVFIPGAEELSAMVGYKFHRGVMAVAGVPPLASWEEVVEKCRSPRLLVALENVISAENVGVIVRNCGACGVDALIVGETSADPYLRRAVRNSMGTLFRLPVIYSKSLKDTLSSLKQIGFSIYAAHPQPESTAIDDANLRSDCCVVLGNEDKGVSSGILQSCSAGLQIPMAPGVDSFNVACASGIILYEVNRQRRHYRGAREGSSFPQDDAPSRYEREESSADSHSPM